MTGPAATTGTGPSSSLAAAPAGKVQGMRWLTREWQSGSLPDDEHATRWTAYLEHRDATAIHLPPALHRLAAAGVDGALTLHRAIPDWWAFEPGKAFTLSVITGDDDHDANGVPQRIVLQYAGNLELSDNPADLDRWLSDPAARLLYDEIEVLPGRRFEQRFLLAPGGELTVRFDNVFLLSAPTTTAERDALLARRARDTTASAVSVGPAPVPATPSVASKRSVRDLLLGWVPGVRAKR